MSAWLERVRAALAPKGYDVERELASGGMGTVFLPGGDGRRFWKAIGTTRRVTRFGMSHARGREAIRPIARGQTARLARS